MPLQTDLNVTPYWDDYVQDKDFYRILFRPGVSVQTRELNQLQAILQNQIETFGDHLFKSGTIVSGCNFSYNPALPYIKILDLQEDGQPTNPSAYTGFHVRNSANLQAHVIHFESGFESKDPDLNTLYLEYINSGNNYSTNEYSNNDLLEVFSIDKRIFAIDVVNGGTGFSNSDPVMVIPALSVDVSSGTFTNGEVITQSTTGTKHQIVGIFDGANAINKILSVKPLNADLSNTSINVSDLTFKIGYNVVGNTSSAVANVVSGAGIGASAVLATDSLGVITTISMRGGGNSYVVLPTVVVKPSSATASVSTLELTARDYIAKIRVANNAFSAPVGNGYAFSVTEGVIFQKGFFSRVSDQSVLVSKYNSLPNNLSVGFSSDESLIKYTDDTTLYDNAANTYNEGAPGADRLRIRPSLLVVNTDVGASNSEFLPLVEFVEGKPAKEFRHTQYNELAKEFERRTSDASGNFVIDTFRNTTKEKTSNTTHFDIVIDSGSAYISGKRVETFGYLNKSVQKSNTVFTKSNQTITANYGNYVKVNNLVGFFDFKSGATVTLYDTAKTYANSVTVGSSYTITPAGSSIGTAKMRSLVYDQGILGTPDASYRLYLFDIAMDSGRSFRDVKAFYFDGSYDGICDAVREVDGTTGSNTTFLYSTENPDVIFKTGSFATKSIYDISYTYRTSTENLTLNANGTISITAPVTFQFPYLGGITLSASQEKDFIIAPVSNTAAANAAGSVSGGTATNVLTGTSTSFNTVFEAGDYIQILETGGGSAIDVRRITNIINSTSLVLNSNLSFTDTNANVALFFPAYYPINLDRSGRSITTSANSSVVTVNIGNSSLTSTANVVAFYNIRVPNATQVNKDLNRDLYVKIYTGNNNTLSSSGNNFSGPWSLGIPDVFRLKNVYYGNTASDVDVTQYFYINSYNDGNTVKNAELILKPGSDITISNTQWLLVKLDAYDNNGTEGFITINSYNDIINDSSGFSNNTYINRLEVPEILTSSGTYYDAIDCIDFRPFSTNTAALATSVGSATVNPANTQTLNSDEKYFPVPDSEIVFDLDFYGPRIDRVIITKDTNLEVILGPVTSENPKEPEQPIDSITINRLVVPPYPSLPYSISNTTFNILDNSVGNQSSIVNQRQKKYTAFNLGFASDTRAQPLRYSMADIAKLDRRIQALETQLGLTLLEKRITDLSIPSSNDAAKDRFKNAFLVDDFNNADVVDISNIENTAFINEQNSELLPRSYTFNLENIFDRSDATTLNSISEDRTLMMPFTEYTIVSQLIASKAPKRDKSVSSTTKKNPSPSYEAPVAVSEEILTYFEVEPDKWDTQGRVIRSVSESVDYIFKYDSSGKPIVIDEIEGTRTFVKYVYFGYDSDGKQIAYGEVDPSSKVSVSVVEEVKTSQPSEIVAKADPANVPGTPTVVSTAVVGTVQASETAEVIFINVFDTGGGGGSPGDGASGGTT